MKSAGRVWTPYEDERIRVLTSSGASNAAIAEQIKRSESAVRRRAARLKIVVTKQKTKGK
jgi:IS30 family transposase